jgi:hypothetical protein
MPVQTIQNLLIVDPFVVDYRSLIQQVPAGTQVFILDGASDGVRQIASILARYKDLASIQILSHGSAGALRLGASTLNLGNLQAYQDQLQQWGKALSKTGGKTGDILLYGCDVASGDGAEFVKQLSEITGADVAASNDLTGNSALGGDWDLEVQTGAIAAPEVLDPVGMANYTATLGTPAIGIAKLNDGREDPQNSQNALFKLSFSEALTQTLTLNLTTPAMYSSTGTNVVGTARRTGITTTQTIADQKASDYKLYWRYKGDADTTRNYIDGSQITLKSGDGVGNTEVYVGVEIFDDAIFEPTETVTLGLAAGTGYTVNTANSGVLTSAVVNIVDNEPIISITKVVNPSEGYGAGSTLVGMGKALELKGNLSAASSAINWAQISPSASLNLANTNKFTLEFWTSVNTLPTTDYRLVGYDDNSFKISLTKDGYISVSMKTADGKTVNLSSSVANQKLSLNTWSHIAATYDGSALRLFVNGQELGLDSQSDRKIAPTTGNLTFGDPSIGSPYLLWLDEVRLWNQNRSQGQVQQNILTNFKGDENGLVGYWKLDGDVLDSTSFQNNAVINSNDGSFRGLSLAYFNDAPQSITFQGTTVGQPYTRLSGNPVGGTLTGDNAVSLNVIGSPSAGVNANQFSAHWAGYIIAPKSGNYSFNVTTGDDEGVRVSIDNSAIIDRWSDGSRSNYPSNGNFGIRTYNSTRDVFLEEGKLYPIAVDFFDVAGTATLQLNWSAKDTNGNLFIDNQPIGKENFRSVSNFIENPVAQIGYVEVQSTDISGNPLAIDQGNGLWVPYEITGGTATRLPLPNPTTGAITATNVDYYNSQFQVTSTNAATRLDGIVIPQGESTGRIYFGAIADAIAEGDETIIVKIKPYNIDVLPATPNSSSNSNVTTAKYGLKDSTGNLVDNLPATVTIKDNGRYVSGLYILDTNNRLIGTLQKLSSGASSFTTLNNLNVNTGSADVQVRLSSQPLSNVTVAIAGKTLTFTSANWETPQALTLASPNLSQFNDTNGSPFAGFNISLSNTSNTSDYTLFSTPVAMPVGVPREDLLPLTEDPRAFTQPAVIPEVSIIAKDILVEDEPLVPANFVIRLSDPAPTGGLPVAFNITSSSTASLGIDYKLQATLIKTTQNFAPSTNLISSLGTISGQNSYPGRAFDADTTTSWQSPRYGGYLQYQFPSGQSFVLTEYRLTNAGTENPTNWQFQGSNDGINFTTIDQRSGETFSGLQVRSFAVSNTNAYQYYRINFSTNAQPVFVQVAEFSLFGRPATTTPTYTYTYQVTVPTGATSLEIPIFAINDSINEVPETIQFEVQPADNTNVYRVNSTQKSATMTLLGADRPGLQFASASFTSQFKEFKAIDPTVSPLKGITAQGNLSFADLDRDKDIDAFVVQADGKIRYFENTDSSAQKNSPQFVENTTKNPFNTITVAGNSQLLFNDLDHDTRGLVDVNINGVVKRQLVQGDLDAVVINPNGTTRYYQNNDSSDLRNTPNYQLNATANPFGTINVGIGVNADVVLDDIDADGDDDAFAVRTTDGTVVFFENTDSTDYKTQPKYRRNDQTNDFKNPFANIKLGAGSNLAFADINGDGSDDAYNIKADGTVDYYKSSGVGSGITFALNNDASPLKGITVGNGKLQFVDINGDGDRDGVVRKADGSLVLYDNTTQPKAVFGQAIQSVTTSENGDSVTFGVRLSSQPVQNVTLQFLNPKTTEHSFDKTSLIFTPDNWNQYQAVKVTGVDDAIVDGDIQYSVTLQGTDGDPGYKGVNNLLLMTNKDNDKPVVQGSVQPIGDNTQPQVSATPVYPIVPESLSIKATSGFKATNGNTGTLELIVKFPTGTNNTYSSFLLEGGTIISFDNPTNPLFPTKFQVLEDTVIQNAVGVGIAVRVNLYQGNAGDLTIDNTGAFGFGVIQPAKAPATGKFQISLDRPVEYPIQVLSGFDSTTGLVTVRLNRILGTTPDSYVLKQGSLLRIGDAEAKVLQDTPLTNAASGVVVNVSLNKGTAIATNSIGTALPFVKVNFDLTGLTLLNSVDPTFTVGNIPGLTSGFVGLNARTVFSWGDLNGDGKPDAIAGNYNGTFNFIKNTSSGSTISFDGTDNSLFQSINKAITDANTSSTTNSGVTSYSMPALVDIDNDGDLDLFVGINTASGGQLLFYRNVGTKLNPIFNRDDAKNPFNGTIFGKNVAPTFGDIDKDGKPDLIIGSQSNSTYSAGLRYYLNTSVKDANGKVTNILFTKQSSIQSSEADSYFGAFPVIDNAIPVLTDFDRDGKLDLIVKVAGSSQIRYFNGQYQNVPNTNNVVNNGLPYYPVSGFSEYSNPFSAITATEVNPSLVDLNGDGFADLFVGKYNDFGDNYAYILNQNNQVKAGEIKPGETTGYVTVSPIDDSIQLSDRTVQLTLKNGDNYRLKTTNSLNLGDYLKDPTNQASLLNFPTAIASTQTVPILNAAKVSNNLLQLTSGANQIGEVFLSQPRTLSNDYGFSTQFQLQVSGVTGTTNPATVALLIKSDAKTYSVPFASQLTNGTWNVWVDYNGLTDNLEVRYSQTTRPDAANILQTVSKNDLVGNSTNAAVQVGFRATTTAVGVTNNLLNLSFRDTYNPNVDRVQFDNFASTTGLTLSGTATSTTSNSLSVLRLNSGTGKVGQFVRATPLSVENDGSFSEVIKLQVTNTAPNGKNGRFSLMFGGSATSMGAISLDNQLTAGTWTIWVDYDGSKDLMEVRLATSDTRPASAFYSIPITKAQILGSDASKTLYLGLGGDTSFSYTDTQGTLIDLRQNSTQDVISWSAFDDYNPQSIDPATQLKSISSFPTTTDLAIAASTDSTQVITVNTPNAAKAFFANGSNILRLSNGADQIGQVNSPQPIRFAVDGSFSSFLKVQVSGAPTTNTATLNLLLLSTGKEYSLPVGAALSNGTWNMWLDYNGNNDTLELRYSNSGDRPATANVTQTVGRVDLMGNGDTAQIGFRAITNAASPVTYDLLDWRVLNVYDPQAYVLGNITQKFTPNLTDSLTVVDDDRAGVLIYDSNNQLVTSSTVFANLLESGSSQTFTVKLNSQPNNASVQLTFATNNKREGQLKIGNAASKNSISNSIFLNFTSSNWNQAQSFTVVAQNDAIDDGDVKFQIVPTIASADKNYASISLPKFNFTTVDDDSSALVANGTLGDRVNIIEGITDAIALKLASQPSAATQSVRVTVSPIIEQLQLNGNDAGASDTLTFTASTWNQEQTIRVNAINDNVVEGTQKTKLNVAVERTISYDKFTDLSELLLTGATAATRSGDTVLRLAEQSGQTGTIFYKDQAVSLYSNEKFSSFFRFAIDDPSAIAEGISLVVSSKTNNTNNPQKFMVHFNPKGNQLLIESSGAVQQTINLPKTQLDRFGNNVDTRLNNGQLWSAWVDYDGTTDSLQVRLASDLRGCLKRWVYLGKSVKGE